MAGTERPVVLVRAREGAETDHMAGEVVLGLDLENSDDPVIGFAFHAASRHAVNLRGVHGWKPPPSSYGYGDAFDIEPNVELGARV